MFHSLTPALMSQVTTQLELIEPNMFDISMKHMMISIIIYFSMILLGSLVLTYEKYTAKDEDTNRATESQARVRNNGTTEKLGIIYEIEVSEDFDEE